MNYNKFVFYDEDRDIVIKEISIHNDFIDWVGEQLNAEEDLYYQVPTITPVPVPEDNMRCRHQKPNFKGIDYCGMSLINEYGMPMLEKMFLQWIACLENLEEATYYPLLADLTEKQLAQVSPADLVSLKEVFFEKEDVLKRLRLCLTCTQLLTLPHVVVCYYGL